MSGSVTPGTVHANAVEWDRNYHARKGAQRGLVTESLPGRENLVTPAEADAMIEIMAGNPEVFEIRRTWEPVQSIVTVVRREDGRTLLGYLLPHPWIG